MTWPAIARSGSFKIAGLTRADPRGEGAGGAPCVGWLRISPFVASASLAPCRQYVAD
jgi:hypothetical protein